MKTVYDKHYKDKNYFGDPYPGLRDFFKNYDTDLKILDIGCGQGRDAIYLGRLGYQVIGIDISTVGINQLNEKTSQLGLKVQGKVKDVFNFEITHDYDVLLLDSFLHFYKNDIKKETDFVKRLAKELKKGGILFNAMIKGDQREKHLKNVLEQLPIDWEVILDTYTHYKEADAEFHLYALKKKSSEEDDYNE